MSLPPILSGKSKANTTFPPYEPHTVRLAQTLRPLTVECAYEDAYASTTTVSKYSVDVIQVVLFAAFTGSIGWQSKPALRPAAKRAFFSFHCSPFAKRIAHFTCKICDDLSHLKLWLTFSVHLHHEPLIEYVSVVELFLKRLSEKGKSQVLRFF